MKRVWANLFRILAVGATMQLSGGTGLAQAIVYPSLCITNPTPALSDWFGQRLLALGPDRVLIGVPNESGVLKIAGAAYLYSRNGTLIHTFTEPTPGQYDGFGSGLAQVGNDRVLIGAYGAKSGPVFNQISTGAAYLMATNGALVTIFTNPTPALNDTYGGTVAAVGAERVLISASGDDTGATDAGIAYLYSTNGTLLNTFTNPTPEIEEGFGSSLLVLGNDRILIGAAHDNISATNGGAAYLYDTNGTLLTVFTNPAPVDYEYFGTSLAAVGTDRVLIGAPGSDAAYLYDTNGTRLVTFTSPATNPGSWLGISVAPVGPDRVVIGAYQDSTYAFQGGAAYLFSTNGTLLNTYVKSPPTSNTWFGLALTSAGPDWVLIGAVRDGTGAVAAGAVYLFSTAPSLAIRPGAADTMTVSWPSGATGWTLQQNAAANLPDNWSNAPGVIQDDGTNQTLVLTPAGESQFYRLFKP